MCIPRSDWRLVKSAKLVEGRHILMSYPSLSTIVYAPHTSFLFSQVCTSRGAIGLWNSWSCGLWETEVEDSIVCANASPIWTKLEVVKESLWMPQTTRIQFGSIDLHLTLFISIVWHSKGPSRWFNVSFQFSNGFWYPCEVWLIWTFRQQMAWYCVGCGWTQQRLSMYVDITRVWLLSQVRIATKYSKWKKFSSPVPPSRNLPGMGSICQFLVRLHHDTVHHYCCHAGQRNCFDDTMWTTENLDQLYAFAFV